MAQSLKIYEINGYSKYSMLVKVDGVNREVYFAGGTNMPGDGGRYSTKDKAVQEAIESRKDFGSLVTIRTVLSEENDAAHTPDEVEQQSEGITEDAAETETAPDGPFTESKAQEPTEPTGHKVADVENFQAARSWILKNIEGVTSSMVRNKADVKKVMIEHNIVFTDLDLK